MSNAPDTSARDVVLPFGLFKGENLYDMALNELHVNVTVCPKCGAAVENFKATCSCPHGYVQWLSWSAFKLDWRNAAEDTLAGRVVRKPGGSAFDDKPKKKGGRKKKSAKPAPEPAPTTTAPTIDRSELRAMIDEMLTQANVGKVEEMASRLEQIAQQEAERAAETALAKWAPPIVQVSIDGKKAKKVDGYVHEKFEDILTLAAARINIMLIGPAGCGKTYIASQVAKALGLRSGSVSLTAGASEGHLTGRLLPIGDAGKFEYVPARFVDFYENGGLFLLDEVDAADSNMLLVINQAIANGSFEVPTRVGNEVVKKHKDFICMAAANTYGTGENRLYVGRNQLDEASLDRFRAGQIEMDYDKNIEKMLVPDDELREAAWTIRDKVNANKMRRIVSTRFMLDGLKLRAAGWTVNKILGQLTCGWKADELTKVGRGSFTPSASF
jgi:MoxR-like ATPase